MSVNDAQLPDQTTLDDGEVLYDGNTRATNEWRRMVTNLDEELFTRKDYSPGTEILICNAQRE